MDTLRKRLKYNNEEDLSRLIKMYLKNDSCDYNRNTIKHFEIGKKKPEGFQDHENVLALSFGGSTNMILHMCALSHELGGNLNHFDFDRLSKSTPLLAKFKPASDYNLTEFHAAGGVQILMKKLSN